MAISLSLARLEIEPRTAIIYNAMPLHGRRRAPSSRPYRGEEFGPQ
jgi:hypothetical protein